MVIAEDSEVVMEW